MAALAGYSTVLKLSGTSTAMTAEACTQVSAGPPQVFQITSASKRVVDPAVAVTVYNNGSPLAASAYTLDYLYGVINLPAGGYGTITITGNFLPMWEVAVAQSISINMSAAELDIGALNQAYTAFLPGKMTAEGEVQVLAPLTEDLDTGGTSLTWADVFSGRSMVLLEAAIGSEFFRAWARLTSKNREAGQDGLVTGTLNYKSVSRTTTAGTEVSFGFGTGL